MSQRTEDGLDRLGSWVWNHLGGLVLVFGLAILIANLVTIAWPAADEDILFSSFLTLAFGMAIGTLLVAAIPLVRDLFQR